MLGNVPKNVHFLKIPCQYHVLLRRLTNYTHRHYGICFIFCQQDKATIAGHTLCKCCCRDAGCDTNFVASQISQSRNVTSTQGISHVVVVVTGYTNVGLSTLNTKVTVYQSQCLLALTYFIMQSLSLRNQSQLCMVLKVLSAPPAH